MWKGGREDVESTAWWGVVRLDACGRKQVAWKRRLGGSVAVLPRSAVCVSHANGLVEGFSIDRRWMGPMTCFAISLPFHLVVIDNSVSIPMIHRHALSGGGSSSGAIFGVEVSAGPKYDAWGSKA
jgi:hypothetical protein